MRMNEHVCFASHCVGRITSLPERVLTVTMVTSTKLTSTGIESKFSYCYTFYFPLTLTLLMLTLASSLVDVQCDQINN